MATEVEICNLALSNIRSQGINSLTEGSLQAQQCALKYPILRDFLLSDMEWNFSQSIAPLAPLTIEVFGWSNVYQYPTDCLYNDRLILNYSANSADVGGMISRPRYADDPYLPDLAAQVQYKVMNIDGQRVIVSNDAGLRASYRKRVSDTSVYSSQFVLALSWLLASDIAIPIVGGELGRALRKESLEIYSAYKDAAAVNDMNEEYSPPIESDFITVRR